jgi:glutamine cyclotransferase
MYPEEKNTSAVNSIKVWLIALTLLCVCLSCGTGTLTQKSSNASKTPRDKTEKPADGYPPVNVPEYSFEIVNTLPHDVKAFTQGLVFYDNALFESTGQYGESSLRRIDLRTGRVLKKTDMPAQYFAEGIALLGGKVFQLTWTTHKGFIYDPKTFQKEGEFTYGGEGWGLTTDGESLIMSDGTNQIRFLNPSSYEVKRTIEIFDNNQPLRELNELEYVKGEIYANIWHSDRIARIDPQTGKVLAWIDLKGLLAPTERSDPEAVLNGIAYDEAGDRIFVTGKLWPKLFEIRLRKKSE